MKLVAYEALLRLSDADLASAVYDMTRVQHEIEAEHEERIRPLRDRLAIARNALQERILASGGRALAHPDLIVELECPPDRIDRDIATLRELEGLVPESELRAALCLVQPPPTWSAHAGKLAALARKYGGRVAEIVANGLRRVPSGKPRLIIRERAPEKRASSPEKRSLP